MGKNWFIALLGAALLAIVPATALAHGHHARHHAKRQHQVRTHLRHITAADSSGPGSTGTTTGSTMSDNAGKVTSFDGSKLVVTLTDGSIVRGIVNGDTELSCESASSQSSTDTTDSTDSSDTSDTSTMQSDMSSDGGGDQSSGSTQSSGDQGPSGDQGDLNDQADQNDGDNGQAACTPPT